MTTRRSRSASARPVRRSHLSARWRLTLWYTALFFVAGAVLLSLNYFLVDHSLDPEPRRDPDRGGRQARHLPEPGPHRANRARSPTTTTARCSATCRARSPHEHLEHLLTESAIALGAMTIASLGLGWLIAGRVLRPVHRMTTTAKRLSESNLHERIALDGPDDELKELADTFDAMLARLESAFDGQRRFVADASHELRTPLAIIRAEVDVTLADPDATPAELRAMAETVRDATDAASGSSTACSCSRGVTPRAWSPSPTDLRGARRAAAHASRARRPRPSARHRPSRWSPRS